MIYKTIIPILLLCSQLKAQTSNEKLKIGDNLPNFKIEKIINSKKRTAFTKDFMNGLLILDFWGSGCLTCIEAMPRMEALEKKIGADIKILPVATFEKEEQIVQLWTKNKYLKNLTIPSVVEGKRFFSFFPHTTVPHEVWIYKGKIIAITDSEYVNERNIRLILKGYMPNWPVKYDYYRYDYKIPLFSADSNQIDNTKLIQYVAMSDYKDSVNYGGLSGGRAVLRDTLRKTVRSILLNQPILTSYISEWSRVIKTDSLMIPQSGFHTSQVSWEVADKSRYMFTKTDSTFTQDWVEKNAICFESIYTDTGQNDQQVHWNIIKDLDRLLGLQVRWVKRKENVYSVVKHQNGATFRQRIRKEGENVRISSLIYLLNSTINNPYFFNESGDDDSEIKLDKQELTNINSLRQLLSSYGFDLIRHERDVHRFVFTETDGGRIVDADMQFSYETRKLRTESYADTIGLDTNVLLANNLKRPYYKSTASGLQYKIIVPGNDVHPSAKQKVLVHYEGRLFNGKLFDSSAINGIPQQVDLTSTLPGWNKALQLMDEGAEWEICLPPSLGYGTHTAQGRIPPNSVLIYRIKLLKILR